jgi:pimeloyl-ACP methyl ester carboxylesterase
LQKLALAALRALVERGARTGWTATPAGAMRYAVRGPSGAPPLLLLHGLGDSLAGWAAVVPQLSRAHEVHLVDLPGHGLSARPPDWRLPTIASAAAAYAKKLVDPIVVGHSLGAWIALRLAVSGELSAKKIKLVNPGGARFPREEWAPFRALVSATDRAGVRRYLDKAFHRAPIFMRLFPGGLIEAMQAECAQGILEAVRDEDFLRAEELRTLETPVDLIWAERDRLLPEGTFEFFRRALPRARAISLPRAGHLPHLEAPFALARALLS